ncbi:MAG: CheR family methyltransferase [Bacteroidota bacterium]
MTKLNRFKTTLEQELGLDPNRYQLGKQIINKVNSFEVDNICFKENGPQHDLIDDALIHESYFLRFREQLEWLITQWLPRQLRDKGDGQPIHILSAGCSRGEEVYSIKLLMHKHLPEQVRKRVHVYGVDVSRAMVATAEKGVYTSWSMRGIDQLECLHWFIDYGEKYEVRPFLRDQVNFCRANLMKTLHRQQLEKFPRQFDLILCRNVLIYMTDIAVEKVYSNLSEVLTPGGWLCTGPSDPLPTHRLGFYPHWENELFWLRKSNPPTNLVDQQVAAEPAGDSVPVKQTEEFSAFDLSVWVPDGIGQYAWKSTITEELFAQLEWACQYLETEIAIQLLQEFLDRFPLYEFALLLKGVFCARVDRVTDAISTIRQLLFLNPEHIEGRFLLAQLHASTGNQHQADRHYRMAVEELRNNKEFEMKQVQ